MTPGDYLVWVTLLLYVGAVVSYAATNQWGKMVYFIGAAVLTVGVLMMK